MNLELLTSQEFAKRLKISRSLLFEWLAKGMLIPGKHYIKIGRILRFVWSDDLIADLLQITASAATADSLLPHTITPNRQHKCKLKPQINWDY